MLFIECKVGWSGGLIFTNGDVCNTIEIKLIEKFTSIITLYVESSIKYTKGLKIYDSRFITLSVGQYVTIKSHDLKDEIVVSLTRVGINNITLGIEPEESLDTEQGYEVV